MNINELLSGRFSLSLIISITALLLSYLIAIPVGIISATTKYKAVDESLKFISYLGIALPNFLVALCIMLFMTYFYGDTMTGLFSEEYENVPWSADRVKDFLSRAWLPIFVLGWNATAFALQTVRALMLDENDKLYVMAARARGISGMSLLWRYPAKHSLGPVINSIGFDLSPLCVLQSNVKINSTGSLSQIKSLREQAIDSFDLSISSNNIMEGLTSPYSSFLESIDDVNTMNFFKLAQLLAISEKVRRNRKFLPSFVKNLDKMISSLNDYVHAIDTLDLNLGKPDVRKADARKLPLVDKSIDGIVTSPPYSIALDYVSNDAHSLKALGHDLDDLRSLLIGVRGKGSQKISTYNEDMIKCFSEMYRVLRQGKYCAIVIGDATYQNSKINTIDFTINECKKLGFTLVQNLNKTIFGLYNVMQTDNTLIFLKE
mgnify:CR=1 FL=1